MPKLKLVTDEAPKERPRNKYSDIFEAAFTEHYKGEDPYIRKKGDFVQLNLLVKAYGGAIEMECWQRAVRNYFASERMFYTMAHLCTNFAAFKKCAADRFNQPIEVEDERPSGDGVDWTAVAAKVYGRDDQRGPQKQAATGFNGCGTDRKRDRLD